jgi:hypothetical protein
MDNRYWSYGCPPIMQDGRHITNYTRMNVFDQFIRNTNEIKSGTDYRHFLQTNGDTLLNRERAFIEKSNTCQISGTCPALSGKAPFNAIP